MNRRSLLVSAALLGSALVLSGCSGAVEAESAGATPTTTVTVTATPEPLEQAGAELPDWDFLVDVEMSDMEFSGDYTADMVRLDPNYEEPTVGDPMADRICNSSMNNGMEGAYHFGARNDTFFFSDFYRETVGLDGDEYDIARTVAYYNCPSRFGVVTNMENLGS